MINKVILKRLKLHIKIYKLRMDIIYLDQPFDDLNFRIIIVYLINITKINILTKY
jgi:hypothetical protein